MITAELNQLLQHSHISVGQENPGFLESLHAGFAERSTRSLTCEAV